MPAMIDNPTTKEQAQQRVDQIRAFRQELGLLENAGIVRLPDEQRATVERHHEEILDVLARRFDIDRNEAEKQMSIGMRVASLVGAIAFSAAVFLFFYRFWGMMGTSLQVTILVAMPILATIGVDVAARRPSTLRGAQGRPEQRRGATGSGRGELAEPREKTLYVASILGLFALACFVFNLSVLAGIFNVRDSPGGLLAWGLFALALAYAYRLTWLLFIGVALTAAFVAAITAEMTGIAWGFFLMRPEGLILPGAAALVMSQVEYDRERPAFGGTYRFLGWIGVLFPMLFLAADGSFSYLHLSRTLVGSAYLVAGFVLGAIAVWTAVRQRANVVINTATAFIALLLFVKLFHWWWDWMPQYLFFFLLGVIAVGILVALRRLRTRVWKV